MVSSNLPAESLFHSNCSIIIECESVNEKYVSGTTFEFYLKFSVTL